MKNKILYKYLDVEGEIAMINNHNIQFTNATKLNDPFDCIESLIDYSNIPNEYQQFNCEWLCDIYKTKAENLRKQIWLCSLSKVYNQMLMWSYYNQYKGICIGLNMEKIDKYLRALPCSNIIGAHEYEVQYKNTREKPDYFNSKQNPYIYQLCTKDKAWEHEQEVRLILKNPHRIINQYVPKHIEERTENGILYHHYEDNRFIPSVGSECFESLYLGVSILPQDKEKIIDAATHLNPDIKIYQMETDADSFQLCPKLINNSINK